MQYYYIKKTIIIFRSDQSNEILKTLNEPPGIGTICMESIVDDIYSGMDTSQCGMDKSYPNDYKVSIFTSECAPVRFINLNASAFI